MGVGECTTQSSAQSTVSTQRSIHEKLNRIELYLSQGMIQDKDNITYFTTVNLVEILNSSNIGTNSRILMTIIIITILINVICA